MNTHFAISAVDLSNCDREPIHAINAIQPFGVLIAVTSDWMVARVSANVRDYFGVSADTILGQPAHNLFSADALHSIRNRLSLLRGPDGVERLFSITLIDGIGKFDVALHFSGNNVVIEAEPATIDTFDTTSAVRAMVARLNNSSTMAAFFREGARQVRGMTGFDRVMVYRFDHEGSGEVIAESAGPGIDSFMGLHYPASDIPAQARTLYLRNTFRIITDIGAEPVALEPRLDASGSPLDQSLSMLRAVSPIHVEYLRNMGVAASLSISVVVEGKLWGLFACHHYQPRFLSFAVRSAAELFGSMFSLMLESRERKDAADYETRARALADRLMASIARNSDLLVDPQGIGEIVFDAIPADGIGVFIDGRMGFAGLAPPPAEFARIVQSLHQSGGSSVFTTDCIADIVPEAENYAGRAAGLLAIPLSRRPRDYIVLFRTEQVRSVRWAGNPEKPVEFGPNGARLTPRQSFAAWSQLVSGRAISFSVSEQKVAETLRVALLEVVLRMSESASADRRDATQKQDLLIAELNHRVRNILGLIRGLISQTRDNTISAAAFVETLDDRIQALARAHDQLTADRWSPARLIELLEIETNAYLGAKRNRVTLEGPNVLVEPSAFTTLALVIHELMTNAAKYGALSDSGMVRVTWRLTDDGELNIVWTESGGPAVTAPTRRGFGSTIIERSIPFDLGGTASVSYRLSGLEAQFLIPARHLAGTLPPLAKMASPDREQIPDTQILRGCRVMLLEDSMIIALDAEDMLRALGAEKVLTASSVGRARDMMTTETIHFALLDFNVGNETSLDIADELRQAKIPFAFATGYGAEIDLPERLRDAIVLKKPYRGDNLASLLQSRMAVPRRA